MRQWFIFVGLVFFWLFCLLYKVFFWVLCFFYLFCFFFYCFFFFFFFFFAPAVVATRCRADRKKTAWIPWARAHQSLRGGETRFELARNILALDHAPGSSRDHRPGHHISIAAT